MHKYIIFLGGLVHRSFRECDKEYEIVSKVVGTADNWDKVERIVRNDDSDYSDGLYIVFDTETGKSYTDSAELINPDTGEPEFNNYHPDKKF